MMTLQTTRWLFVSDVDDTLLGDDEALTHLAEILPAAPPTLTIAYNSSRPCASLRGTLAARPQMPAPDYLIGALGTEIEAGVAGRLLTEYTRQLAQGWDRARVMLLAAEMELTPHADEYQTALKASFDVPDEATYHQFAARLETAGLTATLIFSGGHNLDVIPQLAGKGSAIAFLRRRLNVPPEQVVVAGDSGNDVDMFTPPHKGIVVGNADADLKQLQGEHIYHARQTHAAGVLEGLRYWGVLP